MIKLVDLLKESLNEADPKVGTGKKPKGSSRRLYTDEDPTDTVGVKFKTVQDIKNTLSKSSFKSKSHARQSQIINLIHQRVRAAYSKAKNPEVKARLKKGLTYITAKKEASKRKHKKGGLALLTWHHFKVKLPYYKKASEGKLDLEKAKKEYEETYKKISLNMSQIEFQREVGRLEVLGELLIKDKNDKTN